VIDDSVIEALIAARKSGEKISEYPGPMPATMEKAFAIQCAVRDRLGWRQAGWKIGCTSEKAQKALKADGPFPGPLYAERLYKSGSLVQTLASNSRTTEPEIAFAMAHDLPPRGRDYPVDEVLAAVASVHPAIEIVNPRLPRGFDDAVEWYVADGGLNHALVLGEGVGPLPRADYAAILVEVKINGRKRYSGIGANALGGPEIALTWLVNHLIARQHCLKAGDVVTTGVITEVFESALGDEVSAEFTKLGSVSVRL
jgi:2-keto-4-pentenoate hydratase